MIAMTVMIKNSIQTAHLLESLSSYLSVIYTMVDYDISLLNQFLWSSNPGWVCNTEGLWISNETNSSE